MHHQKRAALYPIQLLIVRRKVKISAQCAHGSRTGYLCVFIQMCLIYFHKREVNFVRYIFLNKFLKINFQRKCTKLCVDHEINKIKFKDINLQVYLCDNS